MRYLIAGLGNIGAEYQNTRHNAGFMILDKLAEKEGFQFQTERFADVAKHRIKNKLFFFIKPNTYMNLSGKAVRYWLNQLELSTDSLLVITDDIALPFGKIRIKGKGGDGGHNGLTSIIETLNTDEFPRMRFGIGNDFSKGKQVDFVLGDLSEEEKIIFPEKAEQAINAIKGFAFEGLPRTMTKFNKD